MKTSALIGAGLIVVALSSCVYTVSGLNQGRDGALQFQVPGHQDVTLASSGRYYLWHHYKTRFEGRAHKRTRKLPEDLAIEISESDGSKLQLGWDDQVSWQIGNHGKKSICYVDIASPDVVRVDVESETDSPLVVSLETADLKGDLIRALGGLGVALVAGLIGVPMFLWGLFSRKKR